MWSFDEGLPLQPDGDVTSVRVDFLRDFALDCRVQAPELCPERFDEVVAAEELKALLLLIKKEILLAQGRIDERHEGQGYLVDVQFISRLKVLQCMAEVRLLRMHESIGQPTYIAWQVIVEESKTPRQETKRGRSRPGGNGEAERNGRESREEGQEEKKRKITMTDVYIPITQTMVPDMGSTSKRGGGGRNYRGEQRVPLQEGPVPTMALFSSIAGQIRRAMTTGVEVNVWKYFCLLPLQELHRTAKAEFAKRVSNMCAQGRMGEGGEVCLERLVTIQKGLEQRVAQIMDTRVRGFLPPARLDGGFWTRTVWRRPRGRWSWRFGRGNGPPSLMKNRELQ